MECPKLIQGKIKMCDSEIFDGMVPSILELKDFCQSTEHYLCPFFIGSEACASKEKVAQKLSNWNALPKQFIGA
ncbi:MAG TPA: hypothetical protein VGB16_00895 [candidate division Zixibacteria bacterium]